jgi:hypothetical protein
LLVERYEPSALVDGDAFFAFVRRGAVPPWLPEASAQNEVVTRAAALAAGRYAAGGYTTVYDGVVGPWFLPTFAAASGLPSLHYVVLLPSVERCEERVATRQGHGFTDGPATRKMHGEFARADVAERHVLVDPPDDAAAVVDRIAAAVAGGTVRYDSPPP